MILIYLLIAADSTSEDRLWTQSVNIASYCTDNTTNMLPYHLM